MSALKVDHTRCRHASCVARAAGKRAQGIAAYRFFQAAVHDGIPAAIYTHQPPDEIPEETIEFFSRLVDAAEDAFWEAWLPE